MKTISLVLALAALSVPAAAGAAQTHSHHGSPGKVVKAHASKVKIYGTVTAMTRTSVTVASASKSLTFQRGTVSLAGIRIAAGVEAEGSVRKGALRLSSIHLDDRGLRATGATKVSDDPAGDDRGGLNTATPKPSDDPTGDDRGGLNTTTPKPSDDPAGDDRGGHGQDDGPGHD